MKKYSALMGIMTAILISGGLLTISQVFGDASIAQLGLGGLQFTKSKDISMEAEKLYISPDKVRADYWFLNQSDQDIVTTVAFPMPPIEFDQKLGFTIKHNVPHYKNLDNPVNFKVFVNGKRQAVKLERKIAPGDEEPDRQTASLKFYWTQKFPAKKTTHITNEYQPIKGGGICGGGDSPHGALDCPWSGDVRKDYCMDPATQAGLKKMHYALTWRVDYILTTGANWKGPIKNFELVVDKVKPGFITSFCAANIQKISPTKFRSVSKNFTPQQDIKVIFYESAEPYMRP